MTAFKSGDPLTLNRLYGHFGRKAEGDFFPWERVDLVEDLKNALAA